MTPYIKATAHNKNLLNGCPSAGPYPNITGMRRIWGKNAIIVKCGVYIYNVSYETYKKLD